MSWQKIQHPLRLPWRAAFPYFWDNIIRDLEKRPSCNGVIFGNRKASGKVILGFDLKDQDTTIRFQYHYDRKPCSNLCIVSNNAGLIIARNLTFDNARGELQNTQQAIGAFIKKFPGLFDKFARVKKQKRGQGIDDTIDVCPLHELPLCAKIGENDNKRQASIDRDQNSNERDDAEKAQESDENLYLVFVDAIIDNKGAYKFSHANSKNAIDLEHDKIAQRLKALLWAKKYVVGIEDDTDPPPGDDNPNGEESMITDIAAALSTYRNVILEGVPGTGKTWYARKLSEAREASNGGVDHSFLPRWITFHPAVAYEDFVEGIRPGADRSNATARPRWFWESGEVGDGGGFAVRDGFFLRVCQEACRNPTTKYLVVIDEINRANLPNVLGDLLTLLEKDKRFTFPEPGEAFEPNDDTWVTLPYSGRRFAVPDNVYVLGTMNTSDKSIAPIDAALRRRFAFLTIEPMPAPEVRAKVPADVDPSVAQWDNLNSLLADCLGPDGRLGHSYLLQLGKRIRSSNGIVPEEAIRQTWQLELLPQLIDTLTTHGAIELLAQDNGANWLAARGKNDQDTVVALRNFLERLSLGLQLQGDGFGKGLRVVDLRSDEPSAWPANEDEAGEPRVAAE